MHLETCSRVSLSYKSSTRRNNFSSQKSRESTWRTDLTRAVVISYPPGHIATNSRRRLGVDVNISSEEIHEKIQSLY